MGHIVRDEEVFPLKWEDHGSHVLPGGSAWDLDTRTGRLYDARGNFVRTAKSRARAIRRALQAGGVRNGNWIYWDGQIKRKRNKHRGFRADNRSQKAIEQEKRRQLRALLGF